MTRPLGSVNDRIWRKAIVRAVKRRIAGKGSPHYLDELASQLVAKGMQGDVGALNAIGDRLDGKPAQAIAIQGDPDSPVIFRLAMGDGLRAIEGEIIPTKPLETPLVAIAVGDGQSNAPDE